MKKNDSLFRLIKSLSKSEKRFFKIYSSRHVIGEQNNYVELFDAIDSQKHYNENTLLKKFSGKKFANRLPVAKSYLYELILRSMNVYHAQNSVDAQLRELMGSIDFLYGKGIYEQALKLVAKARKLALEHEKTETALLILQREKQIFEAMTFAGQSEPELAQLHQQTRQLLQQLLITNDYWLLHAKVQYHITQQGISANRNDLDKIAQLLQNPLLQPEQPPAAGYEANLLRYKTLATCYFMMRQLQPCYEYSKKLVLLLEERPELAASEPLTYINAINNLLNTTAALYKHEEREQYLHKLYQMMQDEQKPASEAVQLKLFEAYYYHRMALHISHGDYTNGIACIDKLEEGLVRFADQIDGVGMVMLCFYAFHICFGSEQFERAHNWLLRVLEYEHSNVRRDVVGFAKMLTLLTAFEMGNSAVMASAIKSVYRFLYGKEKQYRLETLVMQFLRSLTPQTTYTNLTSMFKTAQQHLQLLATDAFEKRVFAYFDFTAWVSAKTEELEKAAVNA
ncbi:hypothetical protein C7N43_12220 [Sphingobacteriales bacterium UPWRP_1]|nr:hypothetical protein B6N25_13905 [Sphingobacteriales bacterium TSM_CSS]PSJ76708.1 hypothetical protein C7N43_12220 [Sphingobacteriales bacterium UPWRP_1]